MAKAKRRVLLVDDDKGFLHATSRLLRHAHFLSTAMSEQEALEQVQRHPFDFAAVDYRLGPGQRDGIAVLKALKAVRPDMKCALYSAHATIELTVLAMRAGADDVASKQIPLTAVVATLDGKPRSFRLPTLDESNRECMLRTLAACEDNRSRAARVLGISRQTLVARLKRTLGDCDT